MRLSDDEWVARARERVARGAPWDEPLGEEATAPADSAQPAAATAPPGLRCPYCALHPPLEVVERWEVLGAKPLMRCPSCYGFWAAGDALTNGVRDSTDEHPSFIAAMAPRRCRSCLGYLDDDGVCRKCGQRLPLLDCPACGKTMERLKQNGLTLDSCAACKGLWFDVGELGHAYHLQPVQDLPASMIDEHACDNEPPGWLIMAQTVLRLVVPYL